MTPEPNHPTLIKIARKVFRYDEVLTDWGWTHDVYYDRKTGVCLIADFPKDDTMFETSIIPELGWGEIKVNDHVYKIQVFE